MIDQFTLDRWIHNAVSKHPEKTAIVFNQDSISYASLLEQIQRRVRSLESLGINHGDRVAWYGLNHPEVFTLLFACARLGAVLVPLNWRLAESEVAEVVANCEPKLVFCESSFESKATKLPYTTVINVDSEKADEQSIAELTMEACGPASPDDPLLIVYTSGSTGQPKGVVLTQQAVVCNAAMSVEAHQMTADDTALVMLPLFHVGGLNILPTPIFSLGGTVLLHERFEPAAACLALRESTIAIVVPTLLQAMMATEQWKPADLSRLRGLSIGSTDVPVTLIDDIHALGIPMIQIYGATETSPFAIYQTFDEAMTTVGSIGRAGSACKIRLVTDGVDVDDGQPGEIWVKGDNVLKEYWQDPEQTGLCLNDGWWRTGDIATRDSAGLYWFTDRLKHVIISGGENIYPTELERILREVPEIDEVVVAGRVDPKWGEVPVAVVVTKRDISKNEILAALENRIARYKLPRDILFTETLPRNATGKVVVSAVRKLIASASIQT